MILIEICLLLYLFLVIRFAKIRVKVLEVVDVFRQRLFPGGLFLIDDLRCQGDEEFGTDAQFASGGTLATHLLNDFFANTEP